MGVKTFFSKAVIRQSDQVQLGEEIDYAGHNSVSKFIIEKKQAGIWRQETWRIFDTDSLTGLISDDCLASFCMQPHTTYLRNGAANSDLN